MFRSIAMAVALALVSTGTTSCNGDGTAEPSDGAISRDGNAAGGDSGDGRAPGDDGGSFERDGGPFERDGGTHLTDGQVPHEDGGNLCTYEDTNVCDGSTERWCGGGQCVSCDPGFFNCDRTRGCECEMGCDGTRCAPGNACEGDSPDDCGSESRWCYEGAPGGVPQCRDCTEGFLNCDGLAGCEYTCEEDPCEPCP